VVGVVLALAAAVTVDPIWMYGPASPSDATAGSQPDWYTGFLDGALRLVPPGWEFVWLDHLWSPAILVPLLVVATSLVLVAAYPFLEAWVLGDTAQHHLLDRPRNRPVRTAIGVAGIVFFGLLTTAGSADLAATAFRLSIEGIVTTLQVSVLLGPPLAFEVTRRFCLALQRRDREVAVHGRPTGRIVRRPGGAYVDVHRTTSRPAPAWLLAPPSSAPPTVRPDDRGAVHRSERVRFLLARHFSASRLGPLPKHGGGAEGVGSQIDA
jgi:ubiquinol-cytochrome c reductase cytochrome b subunit